ncbi:MAG: zinc-binding dehydrogenase, partial [Rhodobacterales bacterium]|nr:zinc-binding dehydrogenase [Rhodobacterales bacterium]
AKAAGARVLATASGEAGLAWARSAGADAVYDYRAPDLAERILDGTGGVPVDRIVEVEFGLNVETDSRVIAENGTIAVYGSALDMTPKVPVYPLLFKAVTVDLLLIYLLTPAQRRASIGTLTDLLDRGALDVPIHQTYTLADCAKAHEAVEAGGRRGAVIVTP